VLAAVLLLVTMAIDEVHVLVVAKNRRQRCKAPGRPGYGWEQQNGMKAERETWIVCTCVARVNDDDGQMATGRTTAGSVLCRRWTEAAKVDWHGDAEVLAAGLFLVVAALARGLGTLEE
jgi:hypothetical protein